MASLFEPPALLTVALVLAAGAGAMYYGLRPALRAPLPAVPSENDEVWSVEDPPPPAKRPYIYPADRPVHVAPAPAPPAPAPLPAGSSDPALALDNPPVDGTVLPPTEPRYSPNDADDDDSEEVSIRDLFRPRPPSPPAPRPSPDHATPQD